MATCPECGTSSRTNPQAMSVEKVLVNKPLGTWSLSGMQEKTVVQEKLKLSCICGWYVLGYIDGDHFVAEERKEEA